MTPENPQRANRAVWRRPGLVIAALGLLVGVYAVVSMQSRWHHLEAVADEIGVPPGFDEVGTVSTGSAFCLLICTSDPPAVTLVMTWDGAAAEGCQRLHEGASRVLSDLEKYTVIVGQECGESGSTTQARLAYSTLTKPSTLVPHGPAKQYGHGWPNKIGVPDARYVAWVTVLEQRDY